MTHFKSSMRDQLFNLFEVFGADQYLGREPYPEIDADTARSLLAEVERLAREDLAASYAEGDRNPPVYDPATYSVTMPAEFRKSYEAFMGSEFWRLGVLFPEIGGTPAPRMLWWALAELILGSNAPVWMYASGTEFANVLFAEGNDEQKKWAKLFIDKAWGATMVLTEPDAGSDVGAGRTRAVPQPDGSFHIEGVKRFITSAEHDLSDNIIHYVLARPVGVEGAGGPGTKGLSLFVVPKFHFDPETGELGERNGVFVTNVEKKMGIKVSTTCEMTFGEHGVPAKGWLLGDVHQGIRQMFLIIENARMMVGTKAIATASTGYRNALEYAKTRKQGADLLKSTDKTAPRVAITNHPDVRRSLMLQKSYTEGLRALVTYTASWQDKAFTAKHEGDEATADLADRVNDLLLPLVKGCGSERASELLSQESLQTFGGSGFLQDYPLEQYVRDAKIDSLYEGTTAIQSLDLVFRKIVKDQGVALKHLSGEIKQFLEAEAGNGQLKEERLALGAALGEIDGMMQAVTGWFGEAMGGEPQALYKVGLVSRRILLALGDVIVAWLLQRQADVALQALTQEQSPSEKAFYEGKIAAARFFAREVLPRLASDRRIVEGTNLDAMEISEDAF